MLSKNLNNITMGNQQETKGKGLLFTYVLPSRFLGGYTPTVAFYNFLFHRYLR
jgi:hypothetical protein